MKWSKITLFFKIKQKQAQVIDIKQNKNKPLFC